MPCHSVHSGGFSQILLHAVYSYWESSNQLAPFVTLCGVMISPKGSLPPCSNTKQVVIFGVGKYKDLEGDGFTIG